MVKKAQFILILLMLCVWGAELYSQVPKIVDPHAKCVRELKNGYQRPYDRGTLQKITLAYKQSCKKLDRVVDLATLCNRRIEFARRVGRNKEAAAIKKFCKRLAERVRIDDPTKEECRVRACWKERGAYACQADSTAAGYFGTNSCQKNGITFHCLKRVGDSVQRYPGLIEWSAGPDNGTAICRDLWFGKG